LQTTITENIKHIMQLKSHVVALELRLAY